MAAFVLETDVRATILVAASLWAVAAAAAAPLDPLSLDVKSFESQLAERFQYPPPAPAPREVEDPREGQQLDAEYLASFPDYDHAYSPPAREEARRLLAQLRADARALTHEQFVMRVARIAALADNGHTSISENALRKNTPRLPLRTYLFADGLYVVRARPDLSDLLGARIDSIDGRSVDEVYRGLRGFMGGAENHARLKLIPVLESPGLLEAVGLARERRALTLTGALLDGKPFERRIEAELRDRSARVSSTPRLLFPSNVEADGMVSLESVGSRLPLYLRDPEHLFTIRPMGSEGLYVALGHNADADEGRIAEFLARAVARCASDHPRFVVMDFRMDGGGDYTKTYAFMPALLEALQPDAHVYALTSGWTFSAAITTVGALRQFGGPRVILVGEPVGDRLDFWAEGNAFRLPNAFLAVSYATARHNYGGPCTDPQACFWLNLLYPVRVASLDPDIRAPLTFAAYREHRDPAMEAVLAREASRGPK